MAKSKIKFETERTRSFRAGPLDEQEQKTIAHIEVWGCEVLHISSGKKDDRPLFSYTVGVYDTCGKPEIITVGLLEETAHTLLNNAAKESRKGSDLAVGRHREMIGNIDCEFRPVDSKWVQHLMGWGIWYYSGTDFPVLQAVYPDRENRFPEDDGFDRYFQQPLMQPGAPMGTIEEDFWALNDPDSSLFDWKFPDPPHTGVLLSQTVHDGSEEVTYVSHEAEPDGWRFLGDLMSDGGGPVLSCFHHPIDKDPSLKELADLPLGWFAERERKDAPWVRHQIKPKEPVDDESHEVSEQLH